MLRRGLLKCSSLFLIIFLMCPRRIRPTAPKQHALKRSPKDVLDVNVKFRPDHLSNIVRQNVHENQLDDNEAGFDLSDDEIRKFKLWPTGIIPYYIDVVSFNDKVLRDHIRTFLSTVQRQTRLSFLELPTPPTDDKTRWVFFVNRRGQLGCSDHSILNFTNEGVQHVNLGYDCIWTGGELAEAVLSIAGVPPQHNSPNRDQFIKVIEENIIPEKRYLFNKLTDDQWLFHDVKYDFASAGHFHHHKHSATGRATIEFRNPHSISFLEENVGFTLSDLKKLRMLYNYIVLKKENKVPECDKLFRKGHNFDRYPRITIGLDPKPRKKPNKYLGLPEEHHEKDQQKDRSDEDRSHEDRSHKDSTHEDRSHKDSTHEDRNHEDRSHEDRSHKDSTHEDRSHKDSTHEDRNHKDSTHEDRNHEDRSHEDRSHEDRSHKDSTHEDRSHKDRSHKDSTHEDRNHEDRSHKDSTHEDRSHKDSTHEDRSHKDSTHEDRSHKDSTHEDRSHKDSTHEDSHHEDSHHEDSHHEDSHHEDSHHEDSHHEDSHHEDRSHEKDTEEGGASRSLEHTGSILEDRSNEANDNSGEKLPATRKLDLKSHPAKGKHKTHKIDLLSYLSDYQTGDEHRRKALHKKTLKGNKLMHK